MTPTTTPVPVGPFEIFVEGKRTFEMANDPLSYKSDYWKLETMSFRDSSGHLWRVEPERVLVARDWFRDGDEWSPHGDGMWHPIFPSLVGKEVLQPMPPSRYRRPAHLVHIKE